MPKKASNLLIPYPNSSQSQTVVGYELFFSEPLHSFLPLTPATSGNHQYALCFCEFCLKIPHIHEITQYLSLSDISLNRMSSRSIHIVANGKISFCFMTNIPSYICTTSFLYVCVYLFIFCSRSMLVLFFKCSSVCLSTSVS